MLGSCCGGSLDNESAIRVAWACAGPGGGGYLPLSIVSPHLLVFSRVVLLLIASGRACFGSSGFPSFTLLFMTAPDRAGPPYRLSNLPLILCRPSPLLQVRCLMSRRGEPRYPRGRIHHSLLCQPSHSARRRVHGPRCIIAQCVLHE